MMNFANCRSFGSMGFMGGDFWFYGIIILLIFLAVLYLINNKHHNN
ncbi:hypothetical protein [Companilactobacillus kimchiensis]|nr:hypothetical protein [Companilactobacillus kimchiensis]